MYILIILLYPEPIFSFWGHRAEHGDTPEGWNWWKSLSFTSCLFILGAICISFLQKQLVFNCFFSGMICLEVQDSKGNKRNCMDVPFTDWSTGRCKLGVFLGLWHGSACVLRREIGPIQYGHKVIEDIGTCNYYSWFFFFGGGNRGHPTHWFDRVPFIYFAAQVLFNSHLDPGASQNWGPWYHQTLGNHWFGAWVPPIFRHAFFRIRILTVDHHVPL